LPELEDEGGLNINQSIARLFGFLTRRRWSILGPLFCVPIATIGVLSFIPNRYTSTATLLVVQQQVPQRYVVPNSETDMVSALQAMKEEVLSRTQLLKMINEFGLYPKQRKRRAPEELVSLMLKDIEVVPTVENPLQQTKDFDAFKISFITENAIVAQQVTNNLTSLFIKEYLRNGTEGSAHTTDFLHRAVEEKGKELEAQETRLKDFRMSHVGELPEQEQGNLGILGGLQTQLSNVMTSLERAEQQRAFLQTELETTPRRRATPESRAFGPGNSGQTPAQSAVQAAQNALNALEADRSKLLAKGDTPEHPDIIRNQREIREAQEKLKQAKAAAVAAATEAENAKAPAAGVSQSTEIADDSDVALFKSNLEANRVEIENLKKDEAKLRATIGQYENRIEQTPVRQQQESSILRDTQVLRDQYAELQKKEQESQLATDLQKQQGGQQFRLIDPPSFPTVPTSPKRVQISLSGLAFGLVLGVGLALLMEMRDTSYHTEMDVTGHLGVPFVIGIPVLPTPLEKRRKRWSALLQWAAACAMLVVLMGAEFYVYTRGLK
jgi:polysaccharide chain length determinant protein (PEP-CTERM system associated)